MVFVTALCDQYITASVQLYIQFSHSVYTLPHSVSQDGWTALMLASDSGHTDVVQLLLSSGAQVDLQDKVRHIVNLLMAIPLVHLTAV